MKKIRKILFTAVFAAIALGASAQMQFGVRAGFNASTIRGVDQGIDNVDVKYRPGFQVGVMGQYMATPNFGIESGLYYSAQGVNISAKSNNATAETKLSPAYLQLPVMALYKFNVGQDLFLYPSAGIYFGYGIAGKSSVSGSASGYEADVESDFFGKVNDKEINNRFDMGATVGLNLQYSKIIIGLGYDYGFMKINKESYDNIDDNFNSNIKVTLGYLF